MTFRQYVPALIEENKWRATRYGLDGQLIDFGKERQHPARELIRELLEWFIDDVVDELGSRKEIEYAWRILGDPLAKSVRLATGREHDGRLVGLAIAKVPDPPRVRRVQAVADHRGERRLAAAFQLDERLGLAVQRERRGLAEV